MREINTFIEQEHGLIDQNKRKHIYNVTKHLNSKQMLFLWTFYSSKNPEKMYHGFHRNIIINQLFPALIQINVYFPSHE